MSKTACDPRRKSGSVSTDFCECSCLICDGRIELDSAGLGSSDETSEILRELFQVFAKYMEWELAGSVEGVNFDFAVELFPFCKGCKGLLVQVYGLHEKLEEIKSEIGQVIVNASAQILSSNGGGGDIIAPGRASRCKTGGDSPRLLHCDRDKVTQLRRVTLNRYHPSVLVRDLGKKQQRTERSRNKKTDDNPGEALPRLSGRNLKAEIMDTFAPVSEPVQLETDVVVAREETWNIDPAALLKCTSALGSHCSDVDFPDNTSNASYGSRSSSIIAPNQPANISQNQRIDGQPRASEPTKACSHSRMSYPKKIGASNKFGFRGFAFEATPDYSNYKCCHCSFASSGKKRIITHLTDFHGAGHGALVVDCALCKEEEEREKNQAALAHTLTTGPSSLPQAYIIAENVNTVEHPEIPEPTPVIPFADDNSSFVTYVIREPGNTSRTWFACNYCQKTFNEQSELTSHVPCSVRSSFLSQSTSYSEDNYHLSPTAEDSFHVSGRNDDDCFIGAPVPFYEDPKTLTMLRQILEFPNLKNRIQQINDREFMFDGRQRFGITPNHLWICLNCDAEFITAKSFTSHLTRCTGKVGLSEPAISSVIPPPPSHAIIPERNPLSVITSDETASDEKISTFQGFEYQGETTIVCLHCRELFYNKKNIERHILKSHVGRCDQGKWGTALPKGSREDNKISCFIKRFAPGRVKRSSDWDVLIDEQHLLRFTCHDTWLCSHCGKDNLKTHQEVESHLSKCSDTSNMDHQVIREPSRESWGIQHPSFEESSDVTGANRCSSLNDSMESYMSAAVITVEDVDYMDMDFEY